MPGLDGTGPRGMGPMTGGARGWCNPYGPQNYGGMPYGMPYGYGGGRPYGYGGAMPYGYGGFAQPYGYGRPGFGMGMGYGRGRGMGMGMGRRW